jgi:uncharacterized phage protein gp47/JayE
MPYIKKSIAELKKNIKEQLCAHLEITEELVDDASLINIFSLVIAGSQVEQYADIEFLTKQAFPNQAEEYGVRQWGVVKQIEWVTSRVSAGMVTATGTSGSSIAVDTELVSDNGSLYFVKVAATIPSAGTVDVQIESKVGGNDKNIDPAGILSFVSTPSGIDPTVTVGVDGITGGTDAWTLDQYREAVVSSFAEPPRGGARYDYEFWTRHVVNPINVWVYGHADRSSIADGDVEVYFLIEGYDYNIPPLSDRQRVAAYIDTVRPLGMGSVNCPAITPLAQTFSIKVTPLTEDTKAAILESIQDLHESAGPGGTETVGQIQRAVSDSPGVVDFKVIAPTVDITAGSQKLFTTKMTDITWS